MARRISFVKCLAFVSLIYSFILTVLFMYVNLSGLSNTQIADSTHLQHIRNEKSSGLSQGKHINRNNINTEESHDVLSSKGDNFTKEYQGDNPNWGPHKAAVIVPYRDRLEELLEFAPYLHKFLVKQKIRHQIYVINQVDSYRFNRGSLINIGVLESDISCDYIVMHDVDLLPLNDKLDYSYPALGPYHIASPELHPMYHYASFIGGILVISKKDFASVNGLSNRYFGWGREDDEFYVRLKQGGLLKSYLVEENDNQVTKYEMRRPVNITTGLKTFRHIHEKQKRPRDNAKYFGQKEKLSKMDRETGVMTVKYDLVRRHNLVLNAAPVTMFEVRLTCDFIRTPWCLKKEDHYLLKDVAFQAVPDARAPNAVV